MRVEERLKELGITLGPPPTPGGTYVRYVQVGNLLFLSGTTPRHDGEQLLRGKVGRELTLEQGYEAARICTLNHLRMLKAALGDLDRVERIVRVTGYVNCTPEFNQQPKVINGASDLLVEVFGERGRHVRTALGISGLANDAPVETEMIVQVREAAPAEGKGPDPGIYL